MNTKLMQPVSLPQIDTAMIALSETSDSYLMKVDLPSLPTTFEIGAIYSGKNDIIVDAGSAPLVSIHTQSGKLRAIYQSGALYILLPKSA